MAWQKLLLVLFIACILFIFPKTSKAFECAFDNSYYIQECSYLRPAIDTTHVLAIYCCGADSLYPLPGFYSSVWQMEQSSIPQFFSDNSMGKYILNCDVIVNDLYPIQHPTLDPVDTDCSGGGTGFATGIFEIVDIMVNFADYDEDGDGLVDGFFFIILDSSSTAKGCGCLGDFSYNTKNTPFPV